MHEYWVNPSYYRDQSVSDEEKRIEVKGEGSVLAVPDRASITVGVITEDENLSIAQQENSRAMSNVINALIGIGIPRENIQTREYRVTILYAEEGEKVRGYRVINQVEVVIDEVADTGLLVDTAVNNGANSVSNIEFTLSNQDDYYNKALSIAVKNGQKKARTIANSLGVILNQIPLQIKEISQPSRIVPFQAVMAEGAPIQPGQLKITAAVQEEFSFR
ncbi:SIMPL domain-containing protein [Pseudalkalibacillus caeni]|uniref:DUF541 domain-containing protein n=1 Tax=Exobacillus caeni TaxID=2574798 RepID=A0A5R9F8S0_9BACL|nr:SIMPL domain-containing protein [Pseudalkalibacillus caeni]TLS38919.1 DUF541 domain-containing protein [Pseudalkalibacillus caeni]